jgi:hypothetical protein
LFYLTSALTYGKLTSSNERRRAQAGDTKMTQPYNHDEPIYGADFEEDNEPIDYGQVVDEIEYAYDNYLALKSNVISVEDVKREIAAQIVRIKETFAGSWRQDWIKHEFNRLVSYNDLPAEEMAEFELAFHYTGIARSIQFSSVHRNKSREWAQQHFGDSIFAVFECEEYFLFRGYIARKVAKTPEEAVWIVS